MTGAAAKGGLGIARYLALWVLLLAALGVAVWGRLPRPRTVLEGPAAQGPVFAVDVRQRLGEVSPHVFGANYGPWMVVPYELMDEAKAAGIRFLRFPGGNWGDQHNLRPYQIDAYIRLAKELGATPSISVRLRGGTPEQAADLVRYTNVEKGYNVRFWSIGNEPSLYPDYDTERFNREWRTFAEAMRAVDPTILLIGPDIHQFTADPAANPKDKNGRDWMRAFLEANGDLVDIVSFHRYPFPRCRTCPAPTVEELLASAEEWDAIIPALRQLIRETTGEDKPIAVTEVNSHWSPASGQETTPDGFYNAIWWADVLGRLIAQQVDIVAYFALQTPPRTGPWGLLASREVRPTYYVYVLYRQFGTVLVDARWVSPVPKLSAYAALKDEDTLTVLLVNRSAQPVEPTVKVVGGQVGPLVRHWLLDVNHLAEEQPPLTGAQPIRVSLPPYAVALIAVPIIGP